MALPFTVSVNRAIMSKTDPIINQLEAQHLHHINEPLPIPGPALHLSNYQLPRTLLQHPPRLLNELQVVLAHEGETEHHNID